MGESPESIVESLRFPKKLPFEAIRLATSDRARVAPLLIQELRKYSSDSQGYDENDRLPMIAPYLLAQWQAGEAFETVLDCLVYNDKCGGYRTSPWNARVKDRLENRLHELVCDGELDLKGISRSLSKRAGDRNHTITL